MYILGADGYFYAYNPSTRRFIKVNLENVICAESYNNSFSLFLTADGRVYDDLFEMLEITNVKFISQSNCCVKTVIIVTHDGDAYSYRPENRQLTKVNIRNVESVVTRETYFALTTTDGLVYALGNGKTLYALGVRVDNINPTQLDIQNVKAIVFANYSSIICQTHDNKFYEVDNKCTKIETDNYDVKIFGGFSSSESRFIIVTSDDKIYRGRHQNEDCGIAYHVNFERIIEVHHTDGEGYIYLTDNGNVYGHLENADKHLGIKKSRTILPTKIALRDVISVKRYPKYTAFMIRNGDVYMCGIKLGNEPVKIPDFKHGYIQESRFKKTKSAR